MRVKKKDLRKRLPQLPINYPAPQVAKRFDYEKDSAAVERMCKKLAHNEVEVRDAALNELPRYLAQASASADDNSEDFDTLMLKLCLGLFYCYFHSDKPLVQHECARKMALLVHCPTTHRCKIAFLTAFFKILDREWMNIDKWRLDKFYSLVRKLVFQAICMLVKDSGSEEFVDGVVEAFRKVLIIDAKAVGLTMHVCDVFFDELVRSSCSPDLFCRLARDIPLFAMQRGNYVEKRVLDNFILPIAAGALEGKRPEKVEGETAEIISRMAATVREFSVAKQTLYAVRPLMAEAQQMLEMAAARRAAPDSFTPLTSADRRKRIAKEVQEAERMRTSLSEARKMGGAKKEKKSGAASGEFKSKKKLARPTKRNRDGELSYRDVKRSIAAEAGKGGGEGGEGEGLVAPFTIVQKKRPARLRTLTKKVEKSKRARKGGSAGGVIVSGLKKGGGKKEVKMGGKKKGGSRTGGMVVGGRSAPPKKKKNSI